MKKLKAFQKMLALTVSAFMLAVLPNANALTVSAAEPVTYYLMYDENDNNGGHWYYQLGSSWDADAEHRELYYIQETLKNGDIVIVGNASPSLLTLDVHLSNLTITNTTGALAMVSVTGGIDNCYFNDGTHASITGNVTNAHVYGTAHANFNNNVTNLYSHEPDSDGGPTIGVTGTVSYFEITDSYGNARPFGSNYKADTFRLVNSMPETPLSDYTQLTSGDAPPAQPAASPQPAAPQATKTPAAASSAASDEYDDVPKTGETSPALWLSLLAVSCFGMRVLLRKTVK